ncbi:MAG TPA: FlgD immunoglobulin-like domain containing protein [bacterium]|nr:FlgD immunoglobulin-like domain containing protein [bacterium]HPR88607.1 FlgD immunoglobulin-like domain containing protein [bacterium]
MKRTLVVLLLAVLHPGAGEAGEQLQAILQQDREAGRITQAQSLALQLQAAEDPRLLPPLYQGYALEDLPCPTLIAAEARALLPALSATEQQLLIPLLSRPSAQRLPLSLVTAAGHFRIHYTLTGSDSATEAFVAEAGEAFEYVFALLTGGMGYAEPPADDGTDGPELDIYMMRFSAYGETRFENPVAGSEGRRYSSYIVIDSKFQGGSYATQGLDALHVTAAHEFFHMLQGGYRYFPSTAMDSRFLFEASSTWFEDVAYPLVNDYLQYVRTLYLSPNRPFHLFSNATYGLGIYIGMLQEQYGTRIIRTIWEQLREFEPLDALDKALAATGSDLGRSLASFSIWNAFTASHADTVHYFHDGLLFPEISPLQSLILSDQLAITNAASELETQYYTITLPGGGSYTVSPAMTNPSQWLYTMVILESGAAPRTYTIAGNTPLTFGPVGTNSELRLAVTNIQWPVAGHSQTDADYALTISPRAPAVAMEAGIIRTLPSPFKPEEGGRLQIQFYTPAPAGEARLYIFNERGQTIHAQTMRDLPRGLNCNFWDGRDDAGQTVPAGIYVCAITGIGQFTPHKFALVR